MTSSLSEWWPMMCNKMNVYIDVLWYSFHLTQVAYALRAAEQPGLARRRFRPASLARFRERERHVDVPRDARPAHDDGGRDRSRMSRTAVPCAPPRSAVCTRPLAAVDCETAVRQVAERARALSDAARTHTQQVAGLLVGLRPPAV